MSTPPRSVKIGQDERTGWSSDRPRREGSGPPRQPDIGVRCRVLAPTDRLRYMPGSLVVIVSGSREMRERFADRVVEDKAALLGIDKVRALLSGKVAEEDLEDRALQLLGAAVAKRLDAGQAVILLAGAAGPEAREPFVRMAARLRRPRHLIFIEARRDDVAEDDRAALNEMRRALDAGELGAEGFHTALRLGGGAVSEVKRLVFRPPPEED